MTDLNPPGCAHGVGAAPANRGRPRDPDIEERVFRAARTVFAERGWNGFGMSHVAREAGVGKSALYLRWDSPSELLIQALERHALSTRLGFTDDFRGNLIHYGTYLLVVFSRPGGLAGMRMHIEASTEPELFAQFSRRVMTPARRELHAMIDNAVAAGQIPAQDARELTTIVYGAALSRAALDRLQEGALDEDEAREYATRLVDRLLAGVRLKAGG